MSDRVENPRVHVRPAVVRKVMRWRVLLTRIRALLWAIVALEYLLLPIGPHLEVDEAVFLVIGAAAVVLGRRVPMLALAEVAAAGYLVLEEPGHVLPVVLCLLVVGTAAFTTSLPTALLWTVGAASVAAGALPWNHHPFDPAENVRVIMLIGLAVVGSRIYRNWMNELIADIGGGMDVLLHTSAADCEAVYNAVVGLASVTADHLSALSSHDNDETASRLRDRVRELEDNRAAAIALLSLDMAPVAVDVDSARAFGPDATRPFTVRRPHFLSRRGQPVD